MSVPVKIDGAQVKQVTDLLKAIKPRSGAVGTKDDPVYVVFDISELVDVLAKVAEAITSITKPPQPSYHFEGGGFVHTYAEDRKPDTFAFEKPKVVDSEGGVLDTQPDLNYLFSSSDDSIASIVDNGDGTVTVTYGTAKKLDDGSYAIAEVRAESNEIPLPDGSTIKDVKLENVQLVIGAASGFAGGGFKFPDV